MIVVFKVWFIEVMYSWELLVLMVINEEVQRVLEDTLLEQKLTEEVWRSLDQLARPNEL